MLISAEQLHLSEGSFVNQSDIFVCIFRGAKVTVWPSKWKLSEILILRRLKVSQTELLDINGLW